MIKPRDQLAFLTEKVRWEMSDSIEAMQKWGQWARRKEENKLRRQNGLSVLPATEAEASTTPYSPPVSRRPDVVYVDLYATGGAVGAIGAGKRGQSASLRMQVRARYLKLLCETPSPQYVNDILSAALSLASSHVVFRFPKSGRHYRPGDVVGEAVEPAAVGWRVARMWRDTEAEFVVYVKKEEATNHMRADPKEAERESDAEVFRPQDARSTYDADATPAQAAAN
jgi:hypothetical protein